MQLMTHFNWFDFCLIFIIFLSVIFGMMRGFLREIISLVSWFAAFFIAILFTKSLAVHVGEYVKTEFLSSLVSFFFLFFATLVVGGLINFIVSRLAQKSGLTLLDRLLGGIFGIVRGLMIALLMIFLVSNTTFASRNWFVNAHLTSQLQGMSSWMQDQVMAVAKVTRPNSA